MAELAASGCVQILMGLESMVFRYPGMADKSAELQRMTDAAMALQEAGVAVNACFIVGADGETHASLDRLTEYLVEIAPFAEVQVTVQTPFPGTTLRKRLQRKGRLLADRGWPYYNLLDVTYQPDTLSVEALESRFRELVRDCLRRASVAAPPADSLRCQCAIPSPSTAAWTEHGWTEHGWIEHGWIEHGWIERINREKNERRMNINLRTLAPFLIGSRRAIQTIANSRQATWLALGFVLCAGLFRGV